MIRSLKTKTQANSFAWVFIAPNKDAIKLLEI